MTLTLPTKRWRPGQRGIFPHISKNRHWLYTIKSEIIFLFESCAHLLFLSLGGLIFIQHFLSHSRLWEHSARVDWVHCGVAPNLQWFPQLHLLLLDKQKLSQEVPSYSAAAGSGHLSWTGRHLWVEQHVVSTVRLGNFRQQQPGSWAYLQCVLHLHLAELGLKPLNPETTRA